MKPVRSLILILAMACSGLSACIQAPDCSSEKVFCAALVTDTLGMDDHGANQDAWAGLQQAKENGLADRIEYIESVDPRDYEKNIAYFAKKGFDVIVTSGAGLSDETLRSADLYPFDPAQGKSGSVFVGIDQSFEESRLNLIPLTFKEDQMGFLAGVLAARITKSHVVGAACETSGIDSMWRYCEGFRAGVKFADRSVRTYVIYNDSGNSEKIFVDEDWGYQTGQTLIQRGADVVFAAGGVTGEGALRAAAEAKVYAIGSERDQAAVLGESNSSVVTSILGSVSFEVQNLIRSLRKGNINVPESGQIKFLPLNQKFPESLSRELNALLVQLLNGEIKTGVPLVKP